MKRVPFFFLLFILTVNSLCKKEQKFPQKEIPVKSFSPFIVIHQETLYVEISDTQKEREIGLMFREKLDENRGMFFIFEGERLLSFWMKNTKIPLSIAFINSKKIIVDIQDMKPMTVSEYRSRFPAIYALEVNQGWFEKHNIRICDSVSFHF